MTGVWVSANESDWYYRSEFCYLKERKTKNQHDISFLTLSGSSNNVLLGKTDKWQHTSSKLLCDWQASDFKGQHTNMLVQLITSVF